MKLFSMEHVWKKTEKKFGLKDVTFFINENEWLLISGPIGEGKETLQKIILGFDLEWEGSIYLKNKSIKEIEKYHENIAFIHNHLPEENTDDTIYEYITFPLRLNGVPESEITKEVNSIIKQVSLLVKVEKKMKDLSLQEKVFVAFLRATVLKPSMILIDEPFYQLCNSKRKVILTAYKDNLRNWKGCPVVIFSSYILEWLPLCDRLAVMNEKSLLQIGEPKVLLENPNFAFVAKYLSSEGFSFLKGFMKGNYFLTKDFSFLLPSQLLEEMCLYEGQHLLIGIKATSFQLVDKPICFNDGVTFNAPVHILKEDKNFNTIYSNIGSQPLVAQIKKSDKIKEGEQISLFFSYQDLLFFDGYTEKRLIKRG
jgi:ABC-type sugar transport system ATPase subunit